MEELYAGRLRWDLLHPFPSQDSRERAAGDAAVEEVVRLLDTHIDPEELDATGRLPDGFVAELAAAGLLRLGSGPDVGGWGLSPLNIFRAISAAAGHSTAVALIMAIDNAIGISAYQRGMAPGPLRDLLRDSVRRGAPSCTADTEPHGAANRARFTTATPVDGGAAYILRGEKVFVGNAPIADVIAVVATEGEQRRMFFVDRDTPGLTVHASHEFMGIKGFPNGALSLDDVRVPRERLLVEDAYDVRITAGFARVANVGRVYLIAAPSLAFARLSLRWSADFLGRRTIDGRGLGEYPQIQRLLSLSAADTFAIDALCEWTLALAPPGSRVNTAFEQLAAKNITSVTCWRILDRTMSLLAAEGFETAASKERRGAPPIPLERVLRDARGLRISGGVDFHLDYWAGRLVFDGYYRDVDGSPPPDEDEPVGLDETLLTPRVAAHARFATRQARALARRCADLRRAYPDMTDLLERQRVVTTVNQVVNEILTMSVVIARTAGDPGAADLADVYCTEAAHRLGGLWQVLDEDGQQPPYAEVSARWLAGERPPALTRDLPVGGSAGARH